jgi:dynein heavy chain
MTPFTWTQNEMGRTFDHSAEDFTLERIIEWGFDQYAEKINDISGAATKELAIEVSLNEIRELWEATELDMAPYKDKGHYKIK